MDWNTRINTSVPIIHLEAFISEQAFMCILYLCCIRIRIHNTHIHRRVENKIVQWEFFEFMRFRFLDGIRCLVKTKNRPSTEKLSNIMVVLHGSISLLAFIEWIIILITFKALSIDSTPNLILWHLNFKLLQKFLNCYVFGQFLGPIQIFGHTLYSIDVSVSWHWYIDSYLRDLWKLSIES